MSTARIALFADKSLCPCKAKTGNYKSSEKRDPLPMPKQAGLWNLRGEVDWFGHACNLRDALKHNLRQWNLRIAEADWYRDYKGDCVQGQTFAQDGHARERYGLRTGVSHLSAGVRPEYSYDFRGEEDRDRKLDVSSDAAMIFYTGCANLVNDKGDVLDFCKGIPKK